VLSRGDEMDFAGSKLAVLIINERAKGIGLINLGIEGSVPIFEDQLDSLVFKNPFEMFSGYHVE
jgi:hypothetical protein